MTPLVRLLAFIAAAFVAVSATAQPGMGPPAPPNAISNSAIDPSLLAINPGATGDLIGANPFAVLDAAGRVLPGSSSGTSQDQGDSPGLSTALNVMILLTVITLVPSIMLMCTCFVRMIIVLALLRQALGTPTLPPPQVILGLSLFMTLLVMAPTIDRINSEALVPYQNGEIRDHAVLWEKAKQPVRDFMFAQIEATNNWSSLYMILNYRGIDTSDPSLLTRADVDMISLIPAFMLSELKTAFLMGFRLYLPFLVIDMVISSLLIAMSMMMLPPVLISLPFKLLLFVLVDGWQLVVGSLMSSFVQPGSPAVSLFAPVAPLFPMFT